MATEEQIAYNVSSGIYAGFRIRVGQRLTIPNRTITKLSFRLYKRGSPTGNVTLTIRKVSDDSILASKVWGNASALVATDYPGAWTEVTFDTPVLVDEEVRILVEYSGGNSSNYVGYVYRSADVKADEFYTYYLASYTDVTAQDHTYIYTYAPPVVGRSFGFIIG